MKKTSQFRSAPTENREPSGTTRKGTTSSGDEQTGQWKPSGGSADTRSTWYGDDGWWGDLID